MKVLVVGGTGLIGGSVALHLSISGHAVTVGARRPAPVGSPLAELPAINVDFLAPDQNLDQLAAFDALVFAAGNDFRHIPLGTPEEQYWQCANVQGVPKFLGAAKQSGIRRAVYVGTYYPQTMPHLIESVPYVRSRHAADEGTRALNSPCFEICSVNPPSVIGVVQGLIDKRLKARVQYALGEMPEIPDFAIGGGTNVMSTRSCQKHLLAHFWLASRVRRIWLATKTSSSSNIWKNFFARRGVKCRCQSSIKSIRCFPMQRFISAEATRSFTSPMTK